MFYLLFLCFILTFAPNADTIKVEEGDFIEIETYTFDIDKKLP